MMINAVSSAGPLGKSTGGLIKATVSQVSTSADGGAVTLKLAGGQEVSVQVGANSAQLKAGQNVLVSPADGKIFIADGQATQQTQANPATMVAVNFTLSTAQIQAGFESALLQSLPAETLAQIFEEHGGATNDVLDVLTKIDKLLQGRSIAVDPSDPAQIQRMEQWLRLAIDNPKMLDELMDRIPLMGGKQVAELLDKILSLMGDGKGSDAILNLIANFKIDSLMTATGANAPLLANVNVNNADALANLLKAASGTAPSVLLDLVKQIDASGVSVNTRLNQQEAQKIAGDILTKLPSQTSMNPAMLHSAKAAAVQSLQESALSSAPQRTPAQIQNENTVRQIRAEYQTLTDAAVKTLIGNSSERGATTNNASANANVNRNVSAAPSGQTYTSAITERLDVLKDIVNKGFQPSEPSGRNVSAQSATTQNATAQNTFAQNAPTQNITAQNTNVQAAPVHSATVQSAPTSAQNFTAQNAPAQTFAAQSAPASAMSSSARVDNIAAQRNFVAPTFANTAQVTNFAANQTPDVQARNVSAQPTSFVPSAPAAQPNVNAIRQDIIRSIDNLRTAVDDIGARTTSRNAENIGEKVKILDLVRDTISRIDNSLAPLAREERQVPKNFYDKVISSPSSQVSSETKNAVFSQISAAQDNVAKLIKSVSAKIDNAVNRNDLQDVKQTPSAKLDANAFIKSAPAEISSSPSAKTILDTAQKIWSAAENMRGGFREAFTSLDLQNRVTPLDKQEGENAQVVRQNADALRTSILLDVSNAMREIFSSTSVLQESISLLTNSSQMLFNIEEALLRALRDLESQARVGSREIMDKLNDLLKEFARLHADAAKPPSAQDALARMTPLDVMRAATITAARGLENLSLLAAQTRGAEVQQQVMSLPVKMGAEWTEVHVKFVKKRAQNKDKNGKAEHVSIYLNTAPSALGSVTAHFDYHAPANLKLSIQFEKPEATRWFKSQTAELREVLSSAGLNVTFDFRTKPKRAAPVAAKIDTKIDAPEADTFAGIINNDKVDYKA